MGAILVHVCKDDNGGCEDLCVALPDRQSQLRLCVCAYGQLATDGTSCEGRKES